MRRFPLSHRSPAGNAYKRINCQDAAVESSGFMLDRYNQCTCNIAGMLVFLLQFFRWKNVTFIAEGCDFVWGRNFTRHLIRILKKFALMSCGGGQM